MKMQPKLKLKSIDNQKRNTVNKPILLKENKEVLSKSNIKVNTSMNSTLTNYTEEEHPIQRKKLQPLSGKIKIDCNADKTKDIEWLNKLSPESKNFYIEKFSEIYCFLNEINLLRFIDQFIVDGFENLEDILEIKEDYFEENKSFDEGQQKRILNKINEIKKKKGMSNTGTNFNLQKENMLITQSQNISEKFSFEKERRPLTAKIENKTEMACECNFDFKVERCWFCFNIIKYGKEIKTQYSNGLFEKEISFCSKLCKTKFEEKNKIFKFCDYCKVSYNISLGDYIYEKYHFDSEECRDKFIENYINKDNSNSLSQVDEEINSKEEEDSEKPYDPMDDF